MVGIPHKRIKKGNTVKLTTDDKWFKVFSVSSDGLKILIADEKGGLKWFNSSLVEKVQ